MQGLCGIDPSPRPTDSVLLHRRMGELQQTSKVIFGPSKEIQAWRGSEIFIDSEIKSRIMQILVQRPPRHHRGPALQVKLHCHKKS